MPLSFRSSSSFALALAMLLLGAPEVHAEPAPAPVTFDSQPAGAEVLLDGRAVCAATPCTVTLTPKTTGTRQVTMRAPNHEPRTESLQLTPGKLVRWVLRQKLGSVYVESRPAGLMLHVDGKATNRATPTTLMLPPGDHRIRVMSPCHDPDVRDVAVKAGESQAIGFDPRPRMRTLDFRAEDGQGRAIRAEILVGGRDGRVIGATPGRFAVPQCERSIMLRHPQFGRSEVRLGATTQRVAAVLDGSNHRLLRLGDYILESRGSNRPRVLVTLINEFNSPQSQSLDHIVRNLIAMPDVHVTILHNPGFRHRHARLAARAAIAAGRQGRFWEMFRRLHGNYQSVGPTDLERHARGLNLDVARFKQDLADPEVEAEVSWHRRVVWALAPRPAPAAYVNGERRDYVRSMSMLTNAIQAEREAVLRPGWTEVMARIRERNPPLAGFLMDGVEPPPEPARPKRNFDTTVWNVPLSGHEPTRGGTAKTALATLVLFKNYYDCTTCREHHQLIERALKTFGDTIQVDYKQSPPPYYARNPLNASRHAECARRQGKFFEFDQFIVDRGRVATGTVTRAVAALGLDSAKLDACLKDPQLEERLDEDAMAALAGNVDKRPVLFVNGRYVSDAPLWEDLEQLIKDEIAKAKARLGKGTSRSRLYATLVGKGRQVQVTGAKKTPINTRGAIRMGSRSSKVNLTLWVDFYSANTRRLWGALSKTRAQLGTRSSVILKVLPSTYHNDRTSGEALYCARAQKKVEPFVTQMLGGRYYRPTLRILKGWAKSAGLDMAAFERCLGGKKMSSAVDADIAEARRAGVRGAPALFVNGYQLSSRAYGTPDHAQLRRYVRLALQQNKARR